MESKLTDNLLTIYFPERIDSTSAAAAEAEINDILAKNPCEQLIIDAENMDYISSAGLRVVLKLRKQFEDLRVINVKSEVYEIFEMTGFAEMITIEKAYRKFSVEGCKIIGQGAKGTVYRYNGDTIIKVYNDLNSLPAIQNERELARKAFVLGIPTAISYDVVKVGDKFGSVFELLDAKSLSQLIAEDPSTLDENVKRFGEMMKLIHGTMVKPSDMPSAKTTVVKWLKNDKDALSDELYAKIEKLVNEIPETNTMVHGDYHTNNVMFQNGEALLIDMDTLSHGIPIVELANVYITYVGFGAIAKDMTEKFLGFSYEMSCEFWKKLLPLYLDTNDESKIAEVQMKTEFLSNLRLINHCLRRGIRPDVVEKAVAEIARDVDKINSFEF